MAERLSLVLLRHGKAEEYSGDAVIDHTRRLTERGIKEATRRAQELAARGFVPSFGLASDAARVKDTRAAVVTSFPGLAWAEMPELYLAEPEAILQVLAGLDIKTTKAVLLIGHNPGLSETASWLLGGRVSLGTAEAACMEIMADSWPQAVHCQGEWQAPSW